MPVQQNLSTRFPGPYGLWKDPDAVQMGMAAVKAPPTVRIFIYLMMQGKVLTHDQWPGGECSVTWSI